MKQNKKIISILIILLLFFQQYQQHLLKTPKKLVDEFVKINDKTLTNGNDAFIAIGNESPNLLAIRLLKEKEMKKFFLLIIGQKKWKSLNEILTPFGEKWKSKILSIVCIILFMFKGVFIIICFFKLDKLPQNIDDSLYKSLKQKEITSNFKEFKRQKEILKEKMEGIEKPQKKQAFSFFSM